MAKGRLEAFSDGVLAIAITLLVLDLRHPLAGESVAHSLRHQLPELAAYLVSFLVLGVTWVNHHGVFRHVRRVSRPVTYVNLLLLLGLVTVPFVASVFADGLRRGGWDAKVAACAFSVVFLEVGVCFALLWWLVTRGDGAFAEGVDLRRARAALPRFAAGSVLYAALVGIAFVSPVAVLVLQGLLALYYVFDQLDLGAPPDAADRAAAD